MGSWREMADIPNRCDNRRVDRDRVLAALTVACLFTAVLLEISPDRNTLYYGDYGLSPSTMYKFNVSGVDACSGAADAVRHRRRKRRGSNAESQWQLYLLYNRVGAEQLRHRKVQNLRFCLAGFFRHRAIPASVSLQSRRSTVYASVHTGGGIQVFNANTFLPLGTISGPEVATEVSSGFHGQISLCWIH